MAKLVAWLRDDGDGAAAAPTSAAPAAPRAAPQTALERDLTNKGKNSSAKAARHPPSFLPACQRSRMNRGAAAGASRIVRGRVATPPRARSSEDGFSLRRSDSPRPLSDAHRRTEYRRTDPLFGGPDSPRPLPLTRRRTEHRRTDRHHRRFRRYYYAHAPRDAETPEAAAPATPVSGYAWDDRDEAEARVYISFEEDELAGVAAADVDGRAGGFVLFRGFPPRRGSPAASRRPGGAAARVVRGVVATSSRLGRETAQVVARVDAASWRDVSLDVVVPTTRGPRRLRVPRLYDKCAATVSVKRAKVVVRLRKAEPAAWPQLTWDPARDADGDARRLPGAGEYRIR